MTANNQFEPAISLNGRNRPTSTTSSLSLDLPIQAPPTPVGQSPHLRHGPFRQLTQAFDSDMQGMRASSACTIKSTTTQATAPIKRKPVPGPNNRRFDGNLSGTTSFMSPEQGPIWKPTQAPPAPTRPNFPGNVSTVCSTTTTLTQPTIRRKPVPKPDRDTSSDPIPQQASVRVPNTELDAKIATNVPPPAPTRPRFPGNVSKDEPYEVHETRVTSVSPHAPRRPYFLWDVPVERDAFEKRQLKNPEQFKAPSATETKPKGKGTDPYHREAYDAFPHVYKAKPKPKPIPRPKLDRNDSSKTWRNASNVFKGLVKKAAKGFTAHRSHANQGKSSLGMSIPVAGSFHNLHPQAPQPGILHTDLKAIPIGEAQKRFAGQPTSGSASEGPVKPRTVKVVGNPDRGTMFEDFIDPEVFDSSSEASVKAAAPPLPPRRHGNNRGDSKPLPPTPRETDNVPPVPTAEPPKRPSRMPGSLRGAIPDRSSMRRSEPRDSVVSGILDVKPLRPEIPKGWERPFDAESRSEGDASPDVRFVPKRPAPPPPPRKRLPLLQPTLDTNPSSPVDWTEIHQGECPSNRRVLYSPKIHSNDDMPRFDEESPTLDELFDGTTEFEISRARRDNYLAGVAPDQDPDGRPAVVEQLFDEIDDAVADSKIPEKEKPWANEEIHRMHRLARQGRRDSDGNIIIDTFPHNGHTSWRATEWSDDRTIHTDHRRFTREVRHSDQGQDSAGLLMEKLDRQMHGMS